MPQHVMPHEVVTITPAPAVDWTVRVDSFEVDGVNRIVESSREAAGKGINVSRAVRRTGISTRAIFPAGGDTGRFLVRELERLGVTPVVVDTGREVRTNITLLAPGSSTKINEPGTPLAHDHLVSLVAKGVEACRDAALIVLAGTLPAEVPTTFVTLLIEALQAQERPVWVDTSGPALTAAVAAGPALIKPNVHELAELTGRSISTFGEVAEAARTVLPDDPDAVVLASMGGDGSMLVSHHATLLARSHDIPMVNTVGAGDALLAGFAAATVEGLSPAESLARAALWGASAVASPTTSFEPDPDFVERITVRELDCADDPLSEPATA
ncbi:1-phosphofructokinase family hexose kinase [Enemella sp. A6]|uniref:1-phosphofructokinase family hexose kinase n=1 Tax=Enemella sp. A6 TaxID=3440152 RepID=UPI003EBD1362